MAKVEEKPKSNGKAKEQPVIRKDGLRLREHAHNVWFGVVPEGLGTADLKKPAVWSAVAGMLQAFDIVRVYVGKENAWCELLVRDAVPGRATMVLLRKVDIGPIVEVGEAEIPNHRIYRDDQHGWCVERTNPDGAIVLMAKGTDHGNWDRKGARNWLETHASVQQTVVTRLYS